MSMIQDLLCVAAAYAAARRLTEARVSTLALGGGRRLRDIREGKDMGIRTCERALLWFSRHWPDGAAWPEGVERPAPAPAAPAAPSAEVA